MKKISGVHGRFNSFAALAEALDIKPPESKPEKPRKCPYCGGTLRHCANSNVWLCDFFTMEENSYVKNEQTIEVYVLRKCFHREFDPA